MGSLFFLPCTTSPRGAPFLWISTETHRSIFKFDYPQIACHGMRPLARDGNAQNYQVVKKSKNGGQKRNRLSGDRHSVLGKGTRRTAIWTSTSLSAAGAPKLERYS